jgi:hypothetical protein
MSTKSMDVLSLHDSVVGEDRRSTMSVSIIHFADAGCAQPPKGAPAATMAS